MTSGSEIAEILEAMARYGPLGLFISSMINNFIPGMPAFYLSFIATYSALTGDALMAVLSAGFGAGIGKVLLFMASSAAASRIGRVKSVRREAVEVYRVAGKSIALMIFIVAAFPIPDDIIYIPLGVTGFSLALFAAAVIAGKLLLSLWAALIGAAYRNAINSYIASMESLWELALVVAGSIIASIGVSVVLLLINWERVYRAYVSSGGREAARTLISEILRLLTLGLKH